MIQYKKNTIIHIDYFLKYILIFEIMAFNNDFNFGSYESPSYHTLCGSISNAIVEDDKPSLIQLIHVVTPGKVLRDFSRLGYSHELRYLLENNLLIFDYDDVEQRNLIKDAFLSQLYIGSTYILNLLDRFNVMNDIIIDDFTDILDVEDSFNPSSILNMNIYRQNSYVVYIMLKYSVVSRDIIVTDVHQFRNRQSLMSYALEEHGDIRKNTPLYSIIKMLFKAGVKDIVTCNNNSMLVGAIVNGNIDLVALAMFHSPDTHYDMLKSVFRELKYYSSRFDMNKNTLSCFSIVLTYADLNDDEYLEIRALLLDTFHDLTNEYQKIVWPFISRTKETLIQLIKDDALIIPCSKGVGRKLMNIVPLMRYITEYV